MKKSFATSGTTTAVAEPEPTPETQSPNPETRILPKADTHIGSPLQNADDMQGDWLRGDIRLPRLNIVQKTSAEELVEQFGIGAIVLNKEIKLGDKDRPVKVTAIRSAKDYIQKLDFDSGETAQVYLTPEEVTAAGGSLNYKDFSSGNFYQARAHIQFAIEAPEGLSETDLALFPYELNGKAYAMAILTVASSAYTSVAKELATLRTSNKVMRNGLVKGTLDLGVLLKKKEAKSWYVPTVKFTGANVDDVVEFLLSI